MARQIITVLTDDLDGGKADRTVEFGIDGVNYTIDLSDAHAGKLRKALDPYIGVASRLRRGAVESRRSAGSDATGSASRDRSRTKAIREWATSNGYEISGRGRIPASIVEAYDAR